MRIVGNIPHESMTISIFQMNGKFQVKFEAGPMEQTFKFTQEQANSLEQLKQLIDSGFIERTRRRFNEMFMDLSSLAG